MFNVALRMVYNADDAADVAQDIMVKLWRDLLARPDVQQLFDLR